MLSDRRKRLRPRQWPLRRQGRCWHVWVCRMGISGCACGPDHCRLCGVRWEDR